MTGLALAASLVIGATPAAAERWYRVARDDRGAAYVDGDSIRQNGAFRQAVTYTFLGEPQRGLHAATILTNYQCAENYFLKVEFRFYGENQALIGTEPSNEPERRWQPGPGSYDASTFEFVCRGTGGTLVSAGAWSDGVSLFRQGAPGN